MAASSSSSSGGGGGGSSSSLPSPSPGVPLGCVAGDLLLFFFLLTSLWKWRQSSRDSPAVARFAAGNPFSSSYHNSPDMKPGNNRPAAQTAGTSDPPQIGFSGANKAD